MFEKIKALVFKLILEYIKNNGTDLLDKKKVKN